MMQDGSHHISGWDLKAFGDCADLIRDSADPINIDPDTCYIGLEHIEEQTLRLNSCGIAQNVTSNKFRFNKGDILFGKLRPYFRKVVIAPSEGICSTDIWVVRAKEGIHRFYLFYWMVSQQFIDDIMRASEGTKMPRAKWDYASRIERYIPPLPEQHAIARILGSLDDKIELNRRMNESLEAMAQAIFKSWFVDFDPVRAKAEGRQPEGMDEETAALFPAEFEVVDGREVPKGWKVAPLSEVIDINSKTSLSKGTVAPYLDMKNMPTKGHRGIEWYDRPFGSGVKFINGDTLLARITPCLENGKTAFIDFLDEKQVGWGSTEYIVLRPKPPLPKEYGYYLARSEHLRAYAIQNMSGTSGRQRVSARSFDTFPIIVPSKEVAEKSGQILELIMITIRENDEQSRTLAALRDTLLPKLISGEIRINANKMGGEE